MKKRSCFVSNSSSSSFICDTCGGEYSGFDCCPSEYEHSVCINGHIMCDEDIIGSYDQDEDEVPEENCPCCKFEILSDNDLKLYLTKKHSVSEIEVLSFIKEKNKRRRVVKTSEYNSYVCNKFNEVPSEIQKELKEKFSNYGEFYNYITSK